MTGNTQRSTNRFSRTPPFLLPGLLMVIVIFAFNYWRASRLNDELLERLSLSQSQLETEKDRYAEKEKIADLLTNQLDGSKGQVHYLEDDKSSLENQLKLRDSDIANLNKQIQELERQASLAQSENEAKITEMNVTQTVLVKERGVMLTFISIQLGREGLQQLEDKVDLGGFQQPSSDIKPKCRESCEAEAALRCRQQMEAAVKQAQAATQQRRDDIIDSPNKDPLAELAQEQSHNAAGPDGQRMTNLNGFEQPGNHGSTGLSADSRNAVGIQSGQAGEQENLGHLGVQNTVNQAVDHLQNGDPAGQSGHEVLGSTGAREMAVQLEGQADNQQDTEAGYRRVGQSEINSKAGAQSPEDLAGQPLEQGGPEGQAGQPLGEQGGPSGQDIQPLGEQGGPSGQDVQPLGEQGGPSGQDVQPLGEQGGPEGQAVQINDRQIKPNSIQDDTDLNRREGEGNIENAVPGEFDQENDDPDRTEEEGIQDTEDGDTDASLENTTTATAGPLETTLPFKNSANSNAEEDARFAGVPLDHDDDDYNDIENEDDRFKGGDETTPNDFGK